MSNQSLTSGLPSTRGLWKNLFDDSFFGKYVDKFWDTASPAINIRNTDNEYEMEIVVPGFKKEDINIDVENDILTISAEAQQETSDEKKGYTRKEYNFSSFSHSFHLPDNAKDDAIGAKYSNGVLTLIIPKTDKQVVSSKKVEIN